MTDIVFLEPQAGAVIVTDSVAVYGKAPGMAIAQVRINGVLGNVVDGDGFVVTVPLKEGPNQLATQVTDTQGHAANATLAVTRKLVLSQKPYEPIATGGCNSTGSLGLATGVWVYFAWVALRRLLYA